MSDMFRDAQTFRAEQAAEAAELSRQEDEARIARAAARVALEEGVLAAAREFRDVMVAHNIRPQPLYAGAEYTVGRMYDWAHPSRLKYFDEIDTGLRGWRPLGIRLDESETSGGWFVMDGPFVTTEGLVLPVGIGFLPLSKAAVEPVSTRLDGRRDLLPARPPAWVLGREPFPVEQAQKQYLDSGKLTVDGVRQTLTETMAHWLDIAGQPR